MQGHLLVHFINQEGIPFPKFPFLGVTLSGGHTQLIKVNDYFEMELLGTTLDDAIGEAFDKCGKRMGLPYPAGPHIDRLAQEGNPHAFSFPIPKLEGYQVSYSGIKTAFTNFLQRNLNKNPNFISEHLNDLCASLQYTLIQIILGKIEQAATKEGLHQIVIGGGVAANSELRKQLTQKARNTQWDIFLPPLKYTTDNAAMIGISAYFKLTQNKKGKLSDTSNARLKF
jgi:N6-L-threonylcarbamoyladenine synthase